MRGNRVTWLVQYVGTWERRNVRRTDIPTYRRTDVPTYRRTQPLCHEDDVSHANARWTSIRFEELIATYGCRGDQGGLLESSTGIQLRWNLYRGIRADKLSAK
jgi:hypothetical protein